jgi:hypothetical protein
METRELGKFGELSSGAKANNVRKCSFWSGDAIDAFGEMSMSILLGNVVVLIDCCAFSLVVLDC